ncbi:MAG: hypothetical protein JNK54_09415 [Elusimicrobia bacterium]|nr:hypothetical protein [Elusimicrobiota bacterium]
MKSPITRLVSIFVLGTFVFTNVVALHSSENAFWESRRAAARERRGPLYASLSGVSATPTLAQIVPKPFTLSAPVSTNFDPIPTRHPLHWVTPLVAPYGTVREVHLSARPSAPLVIHIQDVHGYLDAQENMAKIIQNLAEGSDLSLIGLEGAGGAFSIDDFRRYPNAEIRSRVAHFFLKKDLIGAGEYAALTSTKTLTLWGVEEMSLYRQNVVAVKASLKERTQAQKLVTQIETVLAGQKNGIYSDGLKAFDRLSIAYEKNQIGLGAYIKTLSQLCGTSTVPAQIATFLEALRQEESLDFKAVERDRLRLVDRLVETLDKPALDALVQQSVNYRSGRLTHGQYNSYLEHLLTQQRISLSSFPTLKRYIHYVGLAEEIKRDTLLKELRALEQTTQDKLAQTPEQKRLVFLTVDTKRLHQLINNQMSPEDWKAYSQRQKETHQLPQRLNDPNAVQFPENFSAFLTPFENFCHLALARDKTLSNALLEKMNETQTPTAVLVAGGFHTEGLLQTLKSQGASYIVLTPKIEKIDPQKNYLDVFAHDPLPLEKLFTGEPISLITERALALDYPSPLPSQMHMDLVGKHLAVVNQERQPNGSNNKEILRALKDYLAGLIALVGDRLKRMEVEVQSRENSGVLFTVIFKGKIQWLKTDDNGTRAIPSLPDNGKEGFQRLLTNVRGGFSRFLENLFPQRNLVTPEGISLSMNSNFQSSNGLVIPPLPDEIRRYINPRRELGAYRNIRNYLWSVLNGNPKKLNSVVRSIKFNISHMLTTGETYKAISLIEVLGWVSSDSDSVQFLNQLNFGLRDENASSLLQVVRKEAIQWITSSQKSIKELEDSHTMFYGPFVPIRDKNIDFRSWKLIEHEKRTLWSGANSLKAEVVTELVQDEDGNVFERRVLLSPPPPLIDERRSGPRLRLLKSDGGSKKRLGVHLMLSKSTISDFVTFRWLELMGLCITDVKLEVDSDDELKILRSLSVSQGETKDLQSKTSEIDGLLNLAAFPTMSGVDSLKHFKYRGASGFRFDVNSFHNPGWQIQEREVHDLFNGRFSRQWGHPVLNPSSLERLLVLRMNSVPREEMQTIIEEAYVTTYGSKYLSSYSTEIKIFLDNWDKLRKSLGEHYLVPSLPRTPAHPPVVHAEGMKLIQGGPTLVAGQAVTPETLNEVKETVKRNARRMDVPSSQGLKTVYAAQEILDAYLSFGYASRKEFQTALEKYLTEQFNHSPPLTDEIVIAMLTHSSHLFEDHQGNGFIGVNNQILDLKSPRLAQNIFWMGLGHELAHESQGPRTGKPLREFEETQEKKDRLAFWKSHGAPTNEDRQSLATIIPPGSFKLISHFHSTTQPVYQFATNPLIDLKTQVPINREGLGKYFVASDTTANRVSRILRENDDSSYRELTLMDKENPGLRVVIRKVYLGPQSTQVSYAIDVADRDRLEMLFGLKRAEDFSAEAPGPGDVVITKNGVERMGLPTRKAVALSHKLNSAFGPLNTARQGQKSDPYMFNGKEIVGEAKMIAGVPVWTVTLEDWETINSKPQKEMGAAGLFTWFGIRSPRLIAHLEDIGVALATIAGMNYFEFAPAGDSLVALIEGMAEVTFGLGPLFFVGMMLLHFLTGIVKPDGKISEIEFLKVIKFLSYEPIFAIWAIGHHWRISFLASRTASTGFVMLPFFGAAAVLNAPFLLLVGFLLGTWRHSIRNQKIEREWRILNAALPKSRPGQLKHLNLMSTQSVPMVQPVTIIKEGQPELSDFTTAINQIVPTAEGPLQFGFSHTERHYEVTPEPPTTAKPYLEFIEQLSNEISPTNLEFYANSIELLGMTQYSIRGIIKSAKEDEMFRRVLSRWALAELLLASQGDPKWYSSSPFQREAFQLEQFILFNSSGEVLPLSRLERAAQMAAILRAAGSSISDPSNRGDSEENQKRDQSLLLTAWGLAGNLNPTEIHETYNEILRTVATATLWTGIINPPTSDKTPKTVYFNIDAILDGKNKEAAEKAAQAVEIIAERQREDKNIRLVLVTTLPPNGQTNRDLISQYTLIMTQRYGGWLSVLSNPILISLNDAPNLIDPDSGYLRLLTLFELSSGSGYPTIEFWTHEPQKVIQVPEKKIRVVDFVSIGKVIEKELQKIFFFLIQA